MCWFNKEHPAAIYSDIREAAAGHIEIRPNHTVEPDVLADFQELPFANEAFHLVVMDPPHLFNRAEGTTVGIMHKKYGGLDPNLWGFHISRGFNECWRVLKPFGVLIFKWNDSEIELADVLKCFPFAPLFGQQRSLSGTHWLCFMKGAQW
jgi:23S rRNA G2069 N7-methylase RlmK/C1962 C5-methylase RlmI